MNNPQASAVTGVFGRSIEANGVMGISRNAYGVVAESAASHGVWAAGNQNGVYAQGAQHGVEGHSGALSFAGVLGENNAGSTNDTTAIGVWGRSQYGSGIMAVSNSGVGLRAYSASGTGVVGTGAQDGVAGQTSTDSGSGVHGLNSSKSPRGNGVWGDAVSGYGVYGHSSNGIALVGDCSHGQGLLVSGSLPSRFVGDLDVTGTLSKGALAFKIDHPLDPANKYLRHSGVESPEMKTVYDGVVKMDAQGEAVVEFPSWFQALSQDFRYQLTCLGSYAPVCIAEKVHNNRMKIAGGNPGMEVSWQVTGVRHDAYAQANAIPVEQEKSDDERGTLSPSRGVRCVKRSIYV